MPHDGPADPTLFLPDPSDRIVVIGPNGSGKSVLMRALGSYFDDLIVIDPKLEWSWGGYRDLDPKFYGRPVCTDLRSLYRALGDVRRSESGEPITFRPNFDRDIKGGGVDQVPRWALERKNCILVYDELESTVPPGNIYYTAPGFCAANLQGRSKNVGIWNGVKAPTWVPITIFREAKAVFVFHLEWADDQKRAEQIFGGPIDWSQLRATPHSWMYASKHRHSGPHWIENPL